MANPEEVLISLLKVHDQVEVHSPVWYNDLVAAINDLITHDFNKLVNVLYQADVSEEKLKRVLSTNAGRDAATVIANLFLERQVQKIKARADFKTKPTETDEETW